MQMYNIMCTIYGKEYKMDFKLFKEYRDILELVRNSMIIVYSSGVYRNTKRILKIFFVYHP